MTRDELVTTVEAFAHRSDLTALIESTFIPAAEAAIGRDVQARENQAQYDYPDTETTTRFLALPSDYGRVRSLQFDQARGPDSVVSVDLISLNQYRTSGEPPRVFAIHGDTIEVRPFTGGLTGTLYYWAAPALPEGSSTNAVLTRYPQLYRYAVMAELHDYERDTERMGAMVARYQAEVRVINRQAAREAGNKPAMRRA